MGNRITEDSIIKDISLRKMKDTRVIKLIAHYPLKFLKDKMQNNADWRPVRIRYFGIFGLTKAAKDKWTNNDEGTSKEAFKKIGKQEESAS
jgi:hypothetical protein